jgi:cell division protein FtsL
MTRLNALLLLALVLCSLFLVSKSYEGRRLFSEHQRALAYAQQLESDHERLQIERQAQAARANIERVARRRLQMQDGSAASTLVISGPALAVTAATAASGASR